MWATELRVVGCRTWPVESLPASLVIRSCRSCSVALIRALKLVITAMLVASRSISSSIFRKSFFIFLMVSRRARAERGKWRQLRQGGAALTDTSDVTEMDWVPSISMCGQEGYD